MDKEIKSIKKQGNIIATEVEGVGVFLNVETNFSEEKLLKQVSKAVKEQKQPTIEKPRIQEIELNHSLKGKVFDEEEEKFKEKVSK